MLEVDAVESLDERRHEMAARLLAVGHDVDAGLLLVEHGEAHGVALGLGECVVVDLPGRPQAVRLGEPGGLRQASGDRRREQFGMGGGSCGDVSLRDTLHNLAQPSFDLARELPCPRT